MMELSGENGYQHESRIRPPIVRIPSPGRELQEITKSENNTRANPPSKMLPPSSKHKLTYPGGEPEPKQRKTLAEKAGEPANKSSLPTTASTRKLPQPTSLINQKKQLPESSFGSMRNPSNASTISSRPPSASSRSTSTSSFSSSMGPGHGRSQSAHMGRKQGPNSFSQSTMTRPTYGGTKSRPTTSTSNYSDDSYGPHPGKRDEWTPDAKLKEMMEYFDQIKADSGKPNPLEEAVSLYKQQITVLELDQQRLKSSNNSLTTDLDIMREKTATLEKRLLNATTSLEDQMRAHRIEIDENDRARRNEVEKLRRENTDEVDRVLRKHRDELREVERRSALELDDKIREMDRKAKEQIAEERSRRLREVQELEDSIAKGDQNKNLALEDKTNEIQTLRSELEKVKAELVLVEGKKGAAEKSLAELSETMRKTGVDTTSTITSLEATVASLRARIHFLESGSKAQSDSFAEMESRLQDAVRSAEESKSKLIKEETLRRILFNQVQELKGNIRVMCRVRPVPKSHSEGEVAQVKFPDIETESKELEILGKEEKSSLGTVTRKNHAFSFDRVFGPETQNEEVFGEISQLVQSALDGYNVCIFCYGQTGSGKTHTMSSADGMIPRATHQIYETAENLKDKGWTYTMVGSFVEVYNEEIHDLLGSSKDLDKKKHEIKHDDQKKQTTVTGLKTVTLTSADTVESILNQAANNRSVAATKSNERSSRSHSVFILKLIGRNSSTNETSEGTLNLVDLAGSERLKQSGAEGDRMKETQNINKSLSCLGDVIGALGQGKEGAHIPYRNSKLTYLLQYSLGGNSKTLMFVMASPLQEHVSETLTSLKFATKVHNTHIGTAKKSTKVRDRNSE